MAKNFEQKYREEILQRGEILVKVVPQSELESRTTEVAQSWDCECVLYFRIGGSLEYLMRQYHAWDGHPLIDVISVHEESISINRRIGTFKD